MKPDSLRQGLLLDKSAFLLSLLLPFGALAAPLDALLTADQYHFAGEIRAEASLDAVNNTLDVLKIRASDPIYGGSNVGDYIGQHVRLGYAVTDKLLLDGGLWRRQITYQADDEMVSSWQVAAQYRLFGNVDSQLHFAVRVSAWGNQSSSLVKNSPTVIDGRTVKSVTVDSPSDTQTQLDAVGTWRLSNKASVSGFAGVGRGSVSTGNLSAAYTSSNGCNYLITFTSTDTLGALSAPCTASGTVIEKFGSNQSVLPEFSYDTNYVQFGSMWLWQSGLWALRAGYQFQHLSRNNVDDLIVSRGDVSYQNNHIVVADVFRKVSNNMAVFVRGQAMSNQFVGEIPFVYNSVTASKFGRRYGLVSMGVNFAF